MHNQARERAAFEEMQVLHKQLKLIQKPELLKKALLESGSNRQCHFIWQFSRLQLIPCASAIIQSISYQ